MSENLSPYARARLALSKLMVNAGRLGIVTYGAPPPDEGARVKGEESSVKAISLIVKLSTLIEESASDGDLIAAAELAEAHLVPMPADLIARAQAVAPGF